jgi:flavin reductase ActVB
VTSTTCLDKDALLHALAKFPTGVAIVTTLDRAGRRWGFTASAFTSLSLDPPQVLVCLAQCADCYAVFSSTDRFAANVLRAEHEPLARRFATKGTAKFTGDEFVFSDLGLPVLSDALAIIECGIAARLPGGDHTIIVGDVRATRCGSGDPAVYYDRIFRRFA